MIDCTIEAHRHLGPGLLESTYEPCLAHALSRNGICGQLQLTLPAQYVDLQKMGRAEDRFTDELQRDKAERWHQTFRSLISVLFVLFVSFVVKNAQRPQGRTSKASNLG